MEKQTLKHQFYLYYSHSHSHCLVIKDETFSKRKMVENILQSPFHQLLLLLFSFSFHPLIDILLSLSHRQGSIILILILLPHSQSHMPFHCKGDIIFSIHPFSILAHFRHNHLCLPILGPIQAHLCLPILVPIQAYLGCPFQAHSLPILTLLFVLLCLFLLLFLFYFYLSLIIIFVLVFILTFI